MWKWEIFESEGYEPHFYWSVLRWSLYWMCVYFLKFWQCYITYIMLNYVVSRRQSYLGLCIKQTRSIERNWKITLSLIIICSWEYKTAETLHWYRVSPAKSRSSTGGGRGRDGSLDGKRTTGKSSPRELDRRDIRDSWSKHGDGRYYWFKLHYIQYIGMSGLAVL